MRPNARSSSQHPGKSGFYDEATGRYEDRFSRWPSGQYKDTFQRHLREAYEQKLDVRLILTDPDKDEDWQRVLDGKPGTPEFPKTRTVRKDVIGRVTVLTDDLYVLEFRPDGAVR